jgi:hypothetical protein
VSIALAHPLSPHTLRCTNFRKAAELKLVREQLAGGKESVATLMLHDARANPALYRQVNIRSRSELGVEAAVAMCNEMTGNLGQALRRHLRDNGVKMPSKGVLREEVKKMWHESETGKIVVDDPKKPGKVIVGAWLRVKDVHKVIQTTINRQAAGMPRLTLSRLYLNT